MKIIFICGSLGKGRDGVGDYSRRLAGELIRQGHDVSLLALRDKSTAVIKKEVQESEGIYIPVLRIPNDVKQKIRFAVCKQYVTDFNPEWLSLQYVSFSFQKKGLPFSLANQLFELGKGKKWHIMFHELWVGMDDEAPIKHKIWGSLQKYLARKIIKILKPTIVHTQSILYQYQLKKMGCKALHLPLFGNIQVIENKVSTVDKDENSLDFIVFGTIHPQAPVNEFILELMTYGESNKSKIKLNFIGRCGDELNNWITVCEEHKVEVEVFGEQNSDAISNVLSNSDWGISTTPWRQIEKSGTVAAMLEHGLNVVCVARSWTPKEDIPSNTIKGIVNYKINTLDELLNYHNTGDSKNVLKKCATIFIAALDPK